MKKKAIIFLMLCVAVRLVFEGMSETFYLNVSGSLPPGLYMRAVQINISTVLPMEGGHSYQIRWTEETFTIGNGEKKVVPYSGIFTVQTIKSDDEEQLTVNPIGMYISDFSWSKDASAVNMESETNVNKK